VKSPKKKKPEKGSFLPNRKNNRDEARCDGGRLGARLKEKGCLVSNGGDQVVEKGVGGDGTHPSNHWER